MSSDEELRMRMIRLVVQDQGIAVHRLAKALDIPLMAALRLAHLLAEDDGAFPGPALIRLVESRPGKSLAVRASLTSAGEALWTI